MADNINVEHDPHHGTVPVATDEIGGVHYPVYKVSYGTLGEQTPVSEANPLPVNNEILIEAQLETSNETLTLLNDVLSELKIMNLYNAMTHNQELTKEDLG